MTGTFAAFVVLLMATLASTADVDKAKSIFDGIEDTVKQLKSDPDRPETLSFYNTLNKHLAALGPLSMTIASDESSESKVLRGSFLKVDNNLRSLPKGLEDLRAIAEKSADREAVLEALETVEKFYQDWKIIQSTGTKEKAAEMSNQLKGKFATAYKAAGQAVWEAFSVSESATAAEPVKKDLLYLHRRDAECDVKRVRKVCMSATQLMNKAMVVEAYASDAGSLEQQKQDWVRRIERFSDRCDTFVNDCIQYWPFYAGRVISQVVKEDHKMERGKLAQKIFNQLNEYIENQSFLVVVHDHMEQSEKDKGALYVPEDTTYFAVKDVQNMDVHVFSKPLTNPPAFSHITNSMSRLVFEKTCFPTESTKTVTGALMDKILSEYKYFPLYVVKGSTNPQIMVTTNHLTMKMPTAGCFNKPYYFYVFG